MCGFVAFAKTKIAKNELGAYETWVQSVHRRAKKETWVQSVHRRAKKGPIALVAIDVLF
jgi:hypothetical protein